MDTSPIGHEPAPAIARAFARWAARLRFEDLPDAVVDKVKAIVLMAGHAVLLGHADHEAAALAALVREEEGRPDGATVLAGPGGKASRQGATLANAFLMEASGLFDSYRMITHPGPALVAAALVNAELGSRRGRDVVVALAAGYEFTCRLADDYVPSVSARGFRPAPIFAVMGAAVVAGLLIGLDEDRLLTAIAIAANCASGLNESARARSVEVSLHDPNAARQGVFAAVMASRTARPAAERIIEGEAGFLRAYAGSSTGRLAYAFTGPLQRDVGAITRDLGTTFRLMDVMFRMYPTAGYNQPVIELMGELRHTHDLDPAEIREVVVQLNYLEATYPSPEFPREDWQTPRVDSTQFYAACVAVHGRYPQVGEDAAPSASPALSDDPRVLEFMRTRVRLAPQYDYPMFSPGIVVRTTDGRELSGHYPYARMAWDFAGLAARLQRSRAALGGRAALADRLAGIVADLHALDGVAPLIELLRASG